MACIGRDFACANAGIPDGALSEVYAFFNELGVACPVMVLAESIQASESGGFVSVCNAAEAVVQLINDE